MSAGGRTSPPRIRWVEVSPDERHGYVGAELIYRVRRTPAGWVPETRDPKRIRRKPDALAVIVRAVAEVAFLRANLTIGARVLLWAYPGLRNLEVGPADG